MSVPNPNEVRDHSGLGERKSYSTMRHFGLPARRLRTCIYLAALCLIVVQRTLTQWPRAFLRA